MQGNGRGNGKVEKGKLEERKKRKIGKGGEKRMKRGVKRGKLSRKKEQRMEGKKDQRGTIPQISEPDRGQRSVVCD